MILFFQDLITYNQLVKCVDIFYFDQWTYTVMNYLVIVIVWLNISAV